MVSFLLVPLIVFAAAYGAATPSVTPSAAQSAAATTARLFDPCKEPSPTQSRDVLTDAWTLVREGQAGLHAYCDVTFSQVAEYGRSAGSWPPTMTRVSLGPVPQ